MDIGGFRQSGRTTRLATRIAEYLWVFQHRAASVVARHRQAALRIQSLAGDIFYESYRHRLDLARLGVWYPSVIAEITGTENPLEQARRLPEINDSRVNQEMSLVFVDHSYWERHAVEFLDAWLADAEIGEAPRIDRKPSPNPTRPPEQIVRRMKLPR